MSENAAASASAAADNSHRLPAFFPLILPPCKEIAHAFFAAFEKDALHPETYQAEQLKYETCMRKAGIESKLKLVRVPEQFQNKNI